MAMPQVIGMTSGLRASAFLFADISCAGPQARGYAEPYVKLFDAMRFAEMHVRKAKELSKWRKDALGIGRCILATPASPLGLARDSRRRVGPAPSAS